MRTLSDRPWISGVLVIVLFAVIGELCVSLGDHLFYRIGFNRDVVFSVLWILPIGASFMAAYFADKNKFWFGISYVLVLPVIGATAHYINGELGGTVDFVGMSGAIETFKLYLMLGGVLAFVGTSLGLVLSRRKSTSVKKRHTD